MRTFARTGSWTELRWSRWLAPCCGPAAHTPSPLGCEVWSETWWVPQSWCPASGTPSRHLVGRETTTEQTKKVNSAPLLIVFLFIFIFLFPLTCGGWDGCPLFSWPLLHFYVATVKNTSHRPKQGQDLIWLHSQGGHGFLSHNIETGYIELEGSYE